MKLNLYSTLGVKPKATATEIKKGYRKKAKENHPDRNPNNKQAAKRMLEANEAYEILSDPIEKKKYDAFLMAQLQKEIAKEKAKAERAEPRNPKGASFKEDKKDESFEEKLVETGKSVLASILRVILGR